MHFHSKQDLTCIDHKILPFGAQNNYSERDGKLYPGEGCSIKPR